MSMFTAKELEELRRYDNMIDEAELTYEDFLLEDLVEDLLFPERAIQRKKDAARRARQNDEKRKAGVDLKKKYAADYAKRDKDAEKVRKQAWYRRNKERIRLQQKDYRIRTGRQKAE